MQIAELTDSTALIGNGEALRERMAEDGYVFLRGVIDKDLIAWGEGLYREALAAEDLIDPSVERPVWTGKKSDTWRPCDAIGTEFWHKVVAQPELNAIMRDIYDADPVWIPIAAHRSSFPTGPLKEDQDIFSGRHQDSFYSAGMGYTICWMPVRDVKKSNGAFAVAQGTNRRGVLHKDINGDDHSILPGVIPEADWRSTDFRVGDVLIFDYGTAHAGLPNPSDEFRLSLDVRAVPSYAPRPVIGAVEGVDGRDVTIRTDEGEAVTVRVDDETYIRDMNPHPRIPTDEVERVAYPGSHVMAMVANDGQVTVLRRNRY
jgi:ectoine hydroxylase-related dioxygenase (phytanoyl-CoA dioxygenase family)